MGGCPDADRCGQGGVGGQNRPIFCGRPLCTTPCHTQGLISHYVINLLNLINHSIDVT